MLANGHLHGGGKEVAAQLLSGSHHLIAHHGHAAATRPQLGERLGDAFIGAGGVERVVHIVLAEGGKSIFEGGVGTSLRHGALHQPTHTIAHKSAYVIDGVLRHAVVAQRIVG